jgi:hypothetical protein
MARRGARVASTIIRRGERVARWERVAGGGGGVFPTFGANIKQNYSGNELNKMRMINSINPW